MNSFYVENNFENCPPGLHLARCYRIVDLGTQKTEYMGQTKLQHKISISWEIHGIDDNAKPLRMKDGRPFAIFKNYTLSWSQQANLRLDLQSWRGKEFSKDELNRFDLKNVLGAWCMLNVIERTGNDGRIYANINGITPVPGALKGTLPDAVNDNQIFNLSEPDMKLYETFSDHLKKKIELSPEWQRLQSGQAAPARHQEDATGDVPF